MISLSHKWIWAGINKTATTSMRSILIKECETLLHKHHTLEETMYWAHRKHKIERSDLETFFKFCFVRNPWDRILSIYSYRWKLDRGDVQKNNISFREWVIRCIANEEEKLIYPHKRYTQSQYDWMLLDGKMSMDFVGKFENIDEDWKKLCSLIEIDDIKLPIKNTTKHGNYRKYYSNKTKNIVNRVYIKDIKHFGYTF